MTLIVTTEVKKTTEMYLSGLRIKKADPHHFNADPDPDPAPPFVSFHDRGGGGWSSTALF
jgi:hypothetical protein